MTKEDKIKRYLADELSDSEKLEFESSPEFAKIDRLLKALNNFQAPEYDVDSAYKRLAEDSKQAKRSLSLYERIRPLIRIAAVLLISLTISLFFYDPFSTSSNEEEWLTGLSEVYLPDSSFVSLNEGSQIRFSKEGWSKERMVDLSGEAFFRVKKGSQFTVKTEQGTVSVLGTEFVVKDWDKYYEVICYSGLVKVVSSKNALVLKAKSAYRFIDGKEEKYTISNKSEPDWLNGESSFKSVPLRFVFNEVERQYKVSIEVRNTDLNELFTGGFSHDNLEMALESITVPLNLNYQINGDKILITFEDK